MENRTLQTLQRLDFPNYSPPWGIRTGFWQTLAAKFYPVGSLLPQQLHTVILPDGDPVVLVENKPPHWQSGQRIALLVHGLAGDHESYYMVRMLKRLLQENYHVIRMVHRGCGPGRGLARNPYHCGRSEDPREILKWIQAHYLQSPVTLMGFSMGGNIVLKLAAEDGATPTGNLDSVVAISPPIDLVESLKRMTQQPGRIFERYFVSEVLRDIRLTHQNHPDLKTPEFRRKVWMRDIDRDYTAPRSGFRSALDYYRKASALPLMQRIEIPTLILNADNDPVVGWKAFREIPESPQIDLVVTPEGGHVGHLQRARVGNPLSLSFFMDELILRWCEFHFGSPPTSPLSSS